MRKVTGITKTTLLHNGIWYPPFTEIEIDVEDSDYKFIKEYVDIISQTKKEKPIPDVPQIDRPEVKKGSLKMPSLEVK